MSAPDKPPDILDEAFRFLGGGQSEEQRLSFEQRLRTDANARRALIEALTTKATVEIAYEHIARQQQGETCGNIRKLLTRYQAGDLTSHEIAAFSQHIEDCRPCRTYVRATPDRIFSQRQVKRVLNICALVLVVGVGALWISHVDKTDPTTQSVKALWVLPFEADELKTLEPFTRQAIRDTDSGRLDLAVLAIKTRESEFFERFRKRSDVKQLIGHWMLRQRSMVEQEQVLFLLAWFLDERVPANQRGRSLRELARWIGAPTVSFLQSAAANASDDDLCAAALSGLARFTQDFREDDWKRVRQILQGAIDSRWDRATSLSLHVLERGSRANVAQLSLGLLQGDTGPIGEKTCDRAAVIIARAIYRDNLDEEAARRVILNSDAFVGGHVVIALATTLKTAEWTAAARSLASHRDERVRRLVANYLIAAAKPDDRALLQELAEDLDDQTKSLAQIALQGLQK